MQATDTWIVWSDEVVRVSGTKSRAGMLRPDRWTLPGTSRLVTETAAVLADRTRRDWPRSPLAALRIAAGLTQGQAAAAVGVADTTLARWESGDSRPAPAHIARLALVVGVPGVDVVAAMSATGEGRRVA